MTFLPSPKYVKLPKWVQEDIESLQRKINILEEDYATLQGLNPKSNTKVRMDIGNNKDFYLPKSSRVEFYGLKVKVTVMAHPEGYIRISFDDGVIIPSARNAIMITDEHNTSGRL
jgi:hypothetical protein